MSSLVITVKSEHSLTHLRQRYQLETGKPKLQAQALQQLFHRLAGGIDSASCDVQTATADPVAASSTITLATVLADDTVTIGKTVLTAKAAPAGESQWSQAGTNTANAAALVVKINAHSVLSKLVFASSAAGVVTVSALVKGEVGNHIGLVSSNGTRLAVTGSGYLASGAGGVTEVAVHYALGIA